MLWQPPGESKPLSVAPAPGLPVGAVPALMPTDVRPMLAEASAPFSHPDWCYELKWDGWRAITFGDRVGTRVQSRRGNLLHGQFPALADLRRYVRAERFILDGEIVVLNEQGVPDFERLARRMSQGLTYYVFDLLYLDGYDLTRVPFLERRGELARVLAVDATVRLSDYVVEAGEQLYHMVEQRHLEGVVAKHKRSPYVAGKRHPAWLKIKAVQTLDAVIIGKTRGERAGFGALVLGMYEGNRLVHVGSVGSGFNQRTLSEIVADLEPLTTDRCPVQPVPELDDPVTWLRPERVCEIKFGEWTSEGILRFPVFLRMRPDRDPESCIRPGADEGAAATAHAVAMSAPTAAGAPTAADAPDRTVLVAADQNNASVTIDGVALSLTNLDKIYFPADNITKRDLINYYFDVAPLMVAHLADRALNLKRYPDGIHEAFFFQKHGEKLADWLPRVSLRDERNHRVQGIVCNDTPTLIYLTNLGCIDHNPLQSRWMTPLEPDWLLIDLDPQSECSYDKVVEVAQLLRGLLERLTLRAYPKTSGGRGMHLYVPLSPGATFAQSTMLAELLARLAAERRPDLVTLPRAVNKREVDRVYIDYPQGGRGRSISAPYSVRPRAGAPIATPLEWSEVRAGLRPEQFTLTRVRDRFERKGDIFAPVLQGGQALAAAIANVDRLL